jgi:nitrogen fixation protein NifX
MPTIVRNLRLIDRGVTGDREGPRLRVAISSQHGNRLDAHFGYARRLMVYDVTRKTHRLVQAIGCEPEEPGRPEEEDRIARKVAALAGCHLLFALAIGPPAAARVIQANIHPVKVDAPEEIAAVIARVQNMMTGDPPPWLRRTLAESQASIKGPKERMKP